MEHGVAKRQGDLFEVDERKTAPTQAERERLTELLVMLLREIIAALAIGEVGDDQDHG